MAAMRRARRSRWQLPPCHYEGFLEKRSFKDKVSHKFWAALCGNSLFFYNNSKDSDYVEKQDLSTFISLTDDPSVDRKLVAARLHLRLKDDDLYLTAPSLEARELWKGFIMSVVQLEVPTSLNLLPGQLHMLREAVDKEKERLKDTTEKTSTCAATQASITVASGDPDVYLSVPSEMPACFHRVSRDDAEVLLEKHEDKGNLLLRPSRDGTSFAVTTRQDLNGPVYRHYRVTRSLDGGFAIAVDSPISCTTLHDVVNYMIEKTGGAFKPLVLEHTYEKNIEYIEDDKENGEKCARYASSDPVSLKLIPKPAPRKKYSCQKDNIYQNPSDEEDDNVDHPPPLLPRVPVKTLPHQLSMPDLSVGPGGALLPPTARQRSISVTPETKPKPVILPACVTKNLSHSVHEELKQKLQLKCGRVTSDS
ncbi:signal-transducing adaptor protein 2b [Neoarius graeffei]|uniref:signal-transducing adaptor protein 2b n=1 Tax=Neoarius graeffei TaxID=443677 RepID=UPI00298C5215|nr:signal-transducing adaptor protein 2b [Neoarius graeffei]